MFLNPLMLIGLSAIGVPILVHLLNKRKFDRVVWAAMRFLRISVEQNQRRIRIEDLLLLVLRCVLVALLAITLARPALKSASAGIFGQPKVMAVLVIDNSASMSATDGVESRFVKARKAAAQVIDTFPAGSSVAVILASDIARPLIPEPTFDLNLARKTIADAAMADRPTDLATGLRAAVDTLAGRAGLRKEIYLITDGQSLGFARMAEIQRLLDDTRNEIRHSFVFVGEPLDRNLGISALRQAGGLSPVDQILRFEVQLTNYGTEEVRDVKVSLAVDQDPPMEETTIDTIAPGEARSVSMFAKLRTDGFHTVTARLPADHLPADDTRTVAVRAIKDLKALLVDGNPGREPRDSAGFYLRNALTPVAPAEREQYFVQTTVVSAMDIGTARFDDFDVIALADVADLPSASADALVSYVRRGGGLLVFPGPMANRGYYNDDLFGRRQLLPASLGTAHGDSEQQEKYFVLQGKDYQHPIVAIWSDPRAGTLGSARFYKAFELVPDARAAAPAAGPPRVVLFFANTPTNGPLSTKPAIVERRFGLGRVVLFASTANTAWNDLPMRRAFVPLTHRIVAAISQKQDELLTIRVGDQFVHHVAPDLLGRDVLITRPGQKPGDLPDSLRIEVANGLPTIVYLATDLAGGYQAAISGEKSPVLFAAQADPSESRIESISDAQAEQLSRAAQVLGRTNAGTVEEAIERERVGTELWLPFAIAALILAAMETLLAHWFSRSK